jgi:hypothetical protein
MQMNKQSKSTRSFATVEAARRTGVRTFRFQNWHETGGGPEFSGKGNQIRYEVEALKKWALETFGVIPQQLDL